MFLRYYSTQHMFKEERARTDNTDVLTHTADDP